MSGMAGGSTFALLTYRIILSINMDFTMLISAMEINASKSKSTSTDGFVMVEIGSLLVFAIGNNTVAGNGIVVCDIDSIC